MIQCRNKFLQGWCVLWFWSLLSDGIVWLSCLAVKASCLHTLLSSEVELTVVLIKMLRFAGELFCTTALGHFSAWSDMSRTGMAAKKIMPGKQEKEWEGCSWYHSGYCTAELSLYWLTWGRADFSCWYCPSRATQSATTGGPPCPHQCLAMIPLPAQPPLLSALHCASSFASSATGCSRVELGATATLHFPIQYWDCKNLSSFLGQ